MQSLQSRWLVTVALICLSFATGAKRAIAQTEYPFAAVYDIVVTFEDITTDVSRVSVSGESADAPYGLTHLTSMNYSQVDPETGVTIAGPDAAPFGLQGLPILTDSLTGVNDDRLFGTSSATAVADLTNLTASADGILTITDGSGQFTGATGTLLFVDDYTLSADPTAPVRGQAVVTGYFETPHKIPEPRTNITLVGVGMMGISFLLRQHRLRSASYS